MPELVEAPASGSLPAAASDSRKARQVLEGIARAHGTAPEQPKAAVTVDQARAVCRALDHTPIRARYGSDPASCPVRAIGAWRDQLEL